MLTAKIFHTCFLYPFLMLVTCFAQFKLMSRGQLAGAIDTALGRRTPRHAAASPEAVRSCSAMLQQWRSLFQTTGNKMCLLRLMSQIVPQMKNVASRTTACLQTGCDMQCTCIEIT
jgi:hypothetical protein